MEKYLWSNPNTKQKFTIKNKLQGETGRFQDTVFRILKAGLSG